MAEQVLIVGNGGRENAIADAVGASPEVGPENVFMHADVTTGLEHFNGSIRKPLVIVGPEAPLVAGVADELRDQGYAVLGASKNASQAESSKAWACDTAKQGNILYPETFIARGSQRATLARQFVEGRDPLTYVIKADGLAGGKGVVLPGSKIEAQETVEGFLDGSLHKGAGREAIVFQKREYGPEVSAMVVVGEGKDDFIILPLSQDHKRLLDDDMGPNTGGMGAYAPVPTSIVDARQYQRIEEKAHDSLAAMEARGVKYQKAVLYMGLMMTNGLEGKHKDDSTLIEWNIRFGDPETQVILPLIQKAGVDVYRLLKSAAGGELEMPGVDLSNIGYAALSVCLAAASYPDTPRTGDIISGLDQDYAGAVIQRAGLAEQNGRYVTSGGRVLYVTGLGKNIDEAAANAYAAIGPDGVHFDGNQFRTDIGWQARLGY